jgi:hypothetical protein
MRKLKLLFLIGLLSIYCSIQGQNITNNSSTFYDSTIFVTKDNIPVDPEQYYYPIWFFPETDFVLNKYDTTLVANGRNDEYMDRVLSGKVEMIPRLDSGKYDTDKIEIYSIHLFSMKEPLLFNKKTSVETYRFLLLRTFHNPIVIRLEKSNNDYTVYWKESDGYSGGYSKGKVIEDGNKKVNREDWQEFQTLIDSVQFWSLTHEQNLLGTDGANWILEGSTPSKYQVIDRWSPEKGSFYNTCMFLLNLSDLKIEDEDLY